MAGESEDPFERRRRAAAPAARRWDSFKEGLVENATGLVTGTLGAAWNLLAHPTRLLPVDPIAVAKAELSHAAKVRDGRESVREALRNAHADIKKDWWESSPYAQGLKTVDELSKLLGDAIFSNAKGPEAQGKLAAVAVITLATILVGGRVAPKVLQGLDALDGRLSPRVAPAIPAGEPVTATEAPPAPAEAPPAAFEPPPGASQAAPPATAAGARVPGPKAAKARSPLPNLEAENSHPRVPAPEPTASCAPETPTSKAPTADAPTPEARGPPAEPQDGIAQKIAPETPRGALLTGDSPPDAVTVRNAPTGRLPRLTNEGAPELPGSVERAPRDEKLPALGEDEPAPVPPEVAARQAVARDFYTKNARWETAKKLETLESELQGIDYTKPVEVIELKPGDTLINYKEPGFKSAKGFGRYFTDDPKFTCDELGVNNKLKLETGEVVTRVRVTYRVTRAVRLLRSTAGAITDKWSVPEAPVPTAGGATQFFFPYELQDGGALVIEDVGTTPILK